MNISINFDRHTASYNCPHSPDTAYSTTSNSSLCPLYLVSFPHPQTLATSDLFTLRIIFDFSKTSCKWNHKIHNILVLAGLIQPNILLHATCWVCRWFIPFYCAVEFSCVDIPWFTHWLIEGYLGCFLSFFVIYEQISCKHSYTGFVWM